MREVVRNGTPVQVHHMQYVFRSPAAGNPHTYMGTKFLSHLVYLQARKGVVIMSTDSVFL